MLSDRLYCSSEKVTTVNVGQFGLTNFFEVVLMVGCGGRHVLNTESKARPLYCIALSSRPSTVRSVFQLTAIYPSAFRSILPAMYVVFSFSCVNLFFLCLSVVCWH